MALIHNVLCQGCVLNEVKLLFQKQRRVTYFDYTVQLYECTEYFQVQYGIFRQYMLRANSGDEIGGCNEAFCSQELDS